MIDGYNITSVFSYMVTPAKTSTKFIRSLHQPILNPNFALVFPHHLSIHMMHLRLFPFTSRSNAVLMSCRSTSCVISFSSSSSCIYMNTWARTAEAYAKRLVPWNSSETTNMYDLVHAFLGEDWDVSLGFDPPEEWSHDALAEQELDGRQAQRLAVLLNSQNDRLALSLRRTHEWHYSHCIFIWSDQVGGGKIRTCLVLLNASVITDATPMHSKL